MSGAVMAASLRGGAWTARRPAGNRVGRGRPVVPREGAGRLCYTQRSFVARTAAWTRFRTSSLRRISWMCVFTVFSLR